MVKVIKTYIWVWWRVCFSLSSRQRNLKQNWQKYSFTSWTKRKDKNFFSFCFRGRTLRSVCLKKYALQKYEENYRKLFCKWLAPIFGQVSGRKRLLTSYGTISHHFPFLINRAAFALTKPLKMNMVKRIMGSRRQEECSPQDNALGLMHLRRLFSELCHPPRHMTQKEQEEKLYMMLPVFNRVIHSRISQKWRVTIIKLWNKYNSFNPLELL